MFCQVDPFHFEMPTPALKPTHIFPCASRVMAWLSRLGRPLVRRLQRPDVLRTAMPSLHRLVTHSWPDRSKAIRPHRSDVFESTDCHCQGKSPWAFRNHMPALENHIAPEVSAAMS